ncbi:hypothetical protein PYK79_55935, partial [Streptomyces sp. ID05-04B]|uniref:hypothetical protein n=1 Tax=Streptomyces sp. ID05-04B TaxID=3028661 RepID=UPI0029C5B3CA
PPVWQMRRTDVQLIALQSTTAGEELHVGSSHLPHRRRWSDPAATAAEVCARADGGPGETQCRRHFSSAAHRPTGEGT